jgi:putative sterol carrier protein
MDAVEMFFSVLFAFIVKDFYDIFISSHIKTWLSIFKKKIPNENGFSLGKYKLLITKKEIKEK